MYSSIIMADTFPRNANKPVVVTAILTVARTHLPLWNRLISSSADFRRESLFRSTDDINVSFAFDMRESRYARQPAAFLTESGENGTSEVRGCDIVLFRVFIWHDDGMEGSDECE